MWQNVLITHKQERFYSPTPFDPKLEIVLSSRGRPRGRYRRMTSRRRMEPEGISDLDEATRRAEAFARDTWHQAAITEKYEDADFYVIRGVSPRGEWTVMFDKRTGKRVIPP